MSVTQKSKTYAYFLPNIRHQCTFAERQGQDSLLFIINVLIIGDKEATQCYKENAAYFCAERCW